MAAVSFTMRRRRTKRRGYEQLAELVACLLPQAIHSNSKSGEPASAGLRGSREVRNARLPSHLLRCPPIVLSLERRVLIERGAEEIEQFIHDGVVPCLGRSVRLGEHPLARHVLRRGGAHLGDSLLVAARVGVEALRVP